MRTAKAEGSRDRVGSLKRGLAVMEILAANPAGLTLTETAEKARLTRAGARRFLLTLVAENYARQEGRRFFLSAKLLSVARLWMQAAPIWSHAEPHLRDVSATLGESCSAGVLEGQDVIYVARVAGRRIVSVALHVGSRLPAYCTSMGRVLLSDLSEADLQAFLKKAVIRPNTGKTITDRHAIGMKIDEARRLGYALIDEELELGLRSIAVPVRGNNGRVIAAINASTQSARFECEEMVETFLPRLREAASRIEDVLAVL